MKNVNVTSEKQIAQNKENAIAKSKAKIVNAPTSIFEDVDFMNLEKTVAKIKVTEKTDKVLMYSFERNVNDVKQQKKLRQKIRNTRNKFADNILLFTQKKNEVSLREEVKKFVEFYKKEYILNDFSLLSISSNNRDKDTEEKLTLMLTIINKVNESK